jgi:hypothetical protein
MWPSKAPVRMIANAIICVGLLFWVWLPVQIAVCRASNALVAIRCPVSHCAVLEAVRRIAPPWSA